MKTQELLYHCAQLTKSSKLQPLQHKNFSFNIKSIEFHVVVVTYRSLHFNGVTLYWCMGKTLHFMSVEKIFKHCLVTSQNI